MRQHDEERAVQFPTDSEILVSVAELVRKRVRSLPQGAFLHSRDLVTEVGSRDAVDSALHRLVASGDLVRVRRGIYFKGKPTRFGLTQPTDSQVAYQVAKAAGFVAGVGPAEYSAASALRLTSQVPAHGVLSVPGRAPTATAWVKFVSRSPAARTSLRPIEVALLELLPQWPRFVEGNWDELVERVVELTCTGALDPEAVLAVARRERHVEARRRAEALCEQVGARFRG